MGKLGAGRAGWVAAAIVFTGAMLASGTALAQRTYTIPTFQVMAMCSSGNPTACYEQGLHQYWGDEMPADRYAAYRSWQQSCAGNDLQSCWEVALNVLWDGSVAYKGFVGRTDAFNGSLGIGVLVVFVQ